MGLLPVLAFVRSVVTAHMTEGGTAVDATVGNGHDTLLLARLVGEQGRVFGFDIQEQALQAATARLAQHRLEHRVTLIRAGHEQMGKWLLPAWQGQVQAVMFNLGYLPGGDKKIITHPATTLPALASAAAMLAVGGVVTVVLYTGHEGEATEAEQVLRWCRELPQERYHVLWYQYINQKNAPPSALVIEKRG